MLGQRRRHPEQEQTIADVNAEVQLANEKAVLHPVYQPHYLSDKNTETYIYQILNTVHPMMMAFVDVNLVASMQPTQLVIYLKPLIAEVLEKAKIDLSQAEKIYLEKKLLDEVIGFGPIEPLLRDETVDDVLINGPDQIYVERHGILQTTHIRFRDNQHIMDALTRVLAKIGRRIDENNPYVNGRLADGSRVNAVIPPLTLNAPIVSIRKFRRQQFTLDEMVTMNCLTEEMAEFIRLAIQSHLNILVCGGTGAGKTTLLNALSHEIDPNERILTIEDVAELQLQQEHVVALETRLPNIEGKGGVTQCDLFVNALRMRPNRIIVGEVRGAEVFDMLQAMNTGHAGSLSTIHASSPHEVPTRLIDMVHMTGFTYPADNILRQIADAIAIIIEVERDFNGQRRIRRIVDVSGIEDHQIMLRDLFSYDYINANEQQAQFINHGVKPSFLAETRRYGLEQRILEVLHA